MSYQVELLPSAYRDLKRLAKSIQVRIAVRLRELAADPRPAGVAKLTDKENLWRVRVGEYRIVYEIDDGRAIVTVLRVAHRKDVYRG
jgi:mRNA interferase RelE/StbE